MNQEFLNSINALAGAGNLAEALFETEPDVSVRINPRKKGFVPEGGVPVPWYSGGFYLDSRPRFTLMPELHSGAFYVQDASSMFVATVLRQVVSDLGEEPVIYLDACAAPGGKTTAAIDNLPEGSLVVANEFDGKRLGALRENLMRWGYPDVIVTHGDAARFGKCNEIFDIISADMPCSGEGMMRKEPEAVRQWSRGLVTDCARKQIEIASALVSALKPGGYFIYSTCTFNLEENEKNVVRLVEEFGLEPVAIRCLDDFPGICRGEKVSESLPADTCARFYPGRIRGEGQFVALLRKPGVRKDNMFREKSKRKPTQFDYLLNYPEEYAIGADLYAFPLRYQNILAEIKKSVKVISAGTPLGEVKGKDLVPSHSLALSTALNQDAFPSVELSEEGALDYLSGLPPVLPEGTPRGIVLLRYAGLAIGFAKNIGNRANSLLPAVNRIRMSRS